MQPPCGTKLAHGAGWGVIFEGIVVTRGERGEPHITPLGFTRERNEIALRPFVPSHTLDNLRRHPEAVISLTDEVLVMAGALTGRRDWPLASAARVDGWRLEGCLTSLEIRVEREFAHVERPTFQCAVVAEESHGVYPGTNRSRAAIVETCILVSRLDFIDPVKLEAELAYLHIAVSKTAGSDEVTAWTWLLDAIDAHPRSLCDTRTLRL